MGIELTRPLTLYKLHLSVHRFLHLFRDLFETNYVLTKQYCKNNTHRHKTVWSSQLLDNNIHIHVPYDCTTHQTTALLPMMHRFIRTDLASYSIHVVVSFQLQWML